MDLIAFCNDGSPVIVVYRSIDWERLCMHNLSGGGGGGCTGALAWRADGKFIAVGMDNGSVSLVGMETSQETQVLHGSNVISALHWTSLPLINDGAYDEMENEVNNLLSKRKQFTSRMNENIQLLNDMCADEEDEEEEAVADNEENRWADLLVIGDLDGYVALKLFGAMTVGEVEIGRPAVQVSLSSDILLVLGEDNVLFTYSGELLTSQLSLLRFVGHEFTQITTEFTCAQSCVALLRKTWEDVLEAMKKFLSPLIQQDSLPVGKLLSSLVTMGPSYPELVQFFSTLAQGSFDRLQRQIDQQMQFIVRMIELELSRAMESIVYRMGSLLGVDLQALGVSAAWKHSMVRAAQTLLQAVQHCSHIARETWLDLSALRCFVHAAFLRYSTTTGGEDPGFQESDFTRVELFLQENRLENPQLSKELGLHKPKMFSAQALKQSWDRDYVEEETEQDGAAKEEGRLCTLIDQVETRWKMSPQLISQQMSKTLVLVEQPRKLAVATVVALHGNMVAYVNNDLGGFVIEHYDSKSGGWRLCTATSEDLVVAEEIVYCGDTPGKPAALEQACFALQSSNELVLVGLDEEEVVVMKRIPLLKNKINRLVASGPRGVACALTVRGQFQMYDIAADEDEEDQDDENL